MFATDANTIEIAIIGSTKADETGTNYSIASASEIECARVNAALCHRIDLRLTAKKNKQSIKST